MNGRNLGILWTISFRNLREHAAKTLVVGCIVAVGMVLLVVGNALLATSEAGVRSLYAENFTGDVVVADAGLRSRSLFAASRAARAGEAAPTVPGHRELVERLRGLPWVAGTASQTVGLAAAETADGATAVLQLFGVDPSVYLALFPGSMELVSGRFLRDGEEGIVLPQAVVRGWARQTGREVAPGERILLTASNAATGTKVREATVRGIVRFRREAPNLDGICYVDQTTLRVLQGLILPADASAVLSAEEKAGLGETDEEDLFQGDLLEDSAASEIGGAFGEETLLSILGDASAVDPYGSVDPDACHFVLLRLADGTSERRALGMLNRMFREEGLPLQAYGWAEAAGGPATMVSVMKAVFNLLVLVVAVVAVIVIMNTLVISVTERTAEIGTMRAVGAQRSFIRGMIAMETLAITLLFGLAGILLGGAGIRAISLARIPLSGLFLQTLFGGAVLRPVLGAGAVLSSLATVAAIGVTASLYPAAVALRISPVRAMGEK